MKIGVIGANGNLGSRVVKQALDRGYEVKAFVYMGDCLDKRAEAVERNLFDLTKYDLKGIDVLISAFGGGFHVDPIINKKAFLQYIQLLENTNIKLVTIAGAGSLFTDSTHTQYEYESEKHPQKLKEISRYIREGVDELEKIKNFDWTVVCPSRQFDLKGPYTGQYIVGETNEIIKNDDGESYVTYEDLAKAMIDISESRLYTNQTVTIATKTLK